MLDKHRLQGYARNTRYGGQSGELFVRAPMATARIMAIMTVNKTKATLWFFSQARQSRNSIASQIAANSAVMNLPVFV